MLHIEMRPTNEVMIIDLKGKIFVGAAAERLTDRVHSLLHQGYRKILLNMEFVTRIDSAGFGALLSARRALTEEGGQFGLLNALTRIEQMLIVAGLITHFQLFDSEAEALTAMAPSRSISRENVYRHENRSHGLPRSSQHRLEATASDGAEQTFLPDVASPAGPYSLLREDSHAVTDLTRES